MPNDKQITTNTQPVATNRKTLAQIHAGLVDHPQVKRDEILKTLELKSPASFYDILKGLRKLTQLEKQAIAGIYGKQVEEINWLDEQEPIA